MHIQTKEISLKLSSYSEINACFLLNEHGNLCFLLHNNSVHVILFNLKDLKKIIASKKDVIGYSRMQIMTAKTMTPRTLYVQVILNGLIFTKMLYDIVP